MPQPPTTKNFKKLATILVIVAFSLAGKGATAGALNVYVVNYPLKYFAERIGGEHVNVVFPAPAGIDPAYWIPDTAMIATYQRADLILLNGAGYAGWIDKVSLPRSKLVNTSRDFRDDYIHIEGAVTHSHGPGDTHAHQGAAFTTWIDFKFAARQAKSITDAFSKKEPALRQEFKKNYHTLESDLIEIDKKIRAYSSNQAPKPLIASHPVYDYLARRYDLNIKSVHWEPDQPPTDSQWSELKNILAKHPAQWMIWEAKPMQESVERLKTMGIDSLVFDPCANTPDKSDFLTIMQQNAENLEKVFQ